MHGSIYGSWQGRVYILSSLVIIGAGAIIIRLWQKEVVESPKYRVLAAQEHMVKQNIPAERGRIFAKEEYDDPFPLAMNVTRYQVLVVPNIVRDPHQVAASLAPLLNISEGKIFDKINNRKPYIPPLAEHIEKNLADKINALNLDGVMLNPESDRFYPEGTLAGQALGFVNADGKGQYGLEGYYNDILKSVGGVMVAEKDIQGGYIPVLGETVSEQNGADIYLTLEHNAQFEAEQVLASAVSSYKATGGSLVVLDVKTGGVVAMANVPSYDPNQYNKVASDKSDIFLNPASADAWEPGSIMKPLIMASAIDAGLVTPDTQGVFDSSVVVQGYRIWTAEKIAFGRETMTKVLENSDNVAMVWVADKMGNETEFRYMKSFGMGEKTGVELQSEAGGDVPDLNSWHDVTRATVAFGQGVSTTPLQMAAAYGALANDGVLFEPHITDKIVYSDGKVKTVEKQTVRRVIKSQTAKQVTQMMISVVEDGMGKKAAVPGYWIAGKTGTAQVPNPAGGYYTDKSIGSFAGFFPADNPRFAMVVKLDNPQTVQWAESSAAPTFGEMAKWLLSYYRIPPTR